MWRLTSFKFTGKIDKVTIALKDMTKSAADETDKARKEAALKKRFPTELRAVPALGMFLETLLLLATRPPVCVHMMD